MLYRPGIGILVVCTVALLTPSTVYAHKLIVDAQIRPDAPTTLSIEAYYDPDEPADDVKITLQDSAGIVAAEGRSDAKGVCRLPRPNAGSYTLIADDGQGHRSQKQLDIPSSDDELLEARSERRNRWLMTGVGFGLIACITAIARRIRKKRTP